MSNVEINIPEDDITILHDLQLHDEDGNPYAIGSPPQFQFFSEGATPTGGVGASSEDTAGLNAELKTAYMKLLMKLRKCGEELKMLAQEITEHRLIIPELCESSVLNMLDQPEYIYGFPDKEFLQIVGDTSSDSICSRPRTSVTKTIDHGGGCLRLNNAVLKIPRGALPKGQREVITFEVILNDRHSPGQISPTVRCQPSGLKFLKPVTVQVPNITALQNPKKLQSFVFCNEQEVGQTPLWKATNNRTEIYQYHTCFEVTHFSDYIVTIEGKEYKKLKVEAYASRVDSLDAEQEIRVYMFNDHDEQAVQKVEREEVRLNGIRRGASATLLFAEENKQLMTVHLTTYTDGWKLISESAKKKVNFKNIWHTGEGEFVCRHFMLENCAKTGGFRCSLRIQQEQNEEVAEIDITNPVKVDKQVGDERLSREDVQTLKSLSSRVDNLETREVSSRGLEAANSFPPGSISPDSANMAMLQLLRSATSFQQLQNGIQTCQAVGFKETMIGLHGNVASGMYTPIGYPTLPVNTKEAQCAGQISPQFVSRHMDSVSPRRSQETYLSSSPAQQLQQLPYLVVRDLSNALNPILEWGNDWRMLAGMYQMSHAYVSVLEKNKNPTEEVLKHIFQSKPATQPQDIAKVLGQMDRADAAKILETHLRESSPEPMSTGESSSGGSSPENNKDPN